MDQEGGSTSYDQRVGSSRIVIVFFRLSAWFLIWRILRFGSMLVAFDVDARNLLLLGIWKLEPFPVRGNGKVIDFLWMSNISIQ